MTVTRECIVQEARRYLDAPWVHQGRDEQGMDCVGHILLVAAAFGRNDVVVRDYDRVPSDRELLRLLREHMPENHPAGRYGLGDVLCMHVNGVPTHVGIVGDYAHGGFSVIHADTRAGKVVEHRLIGLPVIASFRLVDSLNV